MLNVLVMHSLFGIVILKESANYSLLNLLLICATLLIGIAGVVILMWKKSPFEPTPEKPEQEDCDEVCE